jgi:glycosyltransferase involved in cell wall biosynthesis
LLLLRALKLACGSGRTVVVLQNQEDIDTLRASGVAEPSNIVLIRGSGVAVAGVPCMPEPPGPPRVILAARMIREKGIAEFVAAAAHLRSEGVKAEFLLAGAPDTGNPHSLTDEEIRTYTAAGEVVHLGHVDDVPKVFGSCHIVCLPTYYNEGVPKALIEAAAAGRPIVTTDQPGCRDIVVHGVNGLLVPARDVLALVRALRELIDDAGLRARLGRAGRERAAREFDVSLVQAQTLSIYSKLAGAGCASS